MENNESSSCEYIEAPPFLLNHLGMVCTYFTLIQLCWQASGNSRPTHSQEQITALL